MISEGVKKVVESTGYIRKNIQYLEDIISAAYRVDRRYYEHFINTTDEGGFTGEFIHQLRNIQDDKIKDDNPLYDGLYVNYNHPKQGELYLSLNLEQIEDEGERQRIADYNRALLEKYDNIEMLIKPDFILHEPNTLNRQEYYGEIKMEGNSETPSDLVKIAKWKSFLEEAYRSREYRDNNLDPRYGLYILIYVYDKDGKTPKGHKRDYSLRKRIERQETIDFSSNIVISPNFEIGPDTYKDIICISLADGIERTITCETLGEILDDLHIG